MPGPLCELLPNLVCRIRFFQIGSIHIAVLARLSKPLVLQHRSARHALTRSSAHGTCPSRSSASCMIGQASRRHAQCMHRKAQDHIRIYCRSNPSHHANTKEAPPINTKRLIVHSTRMSCAVVRTTSWEPQTFSELWDLVDPSGLR